MNQLLSVTEAAKLLGISRTAVLKKIQKGTLNAKKVGNAYVINKNCLTVVNEREISPSQKLIIDRAVAKTIAEYSEALHLLKET